jgi:folate-binding protein YgfZ
VTGAQSGLLITGPHAASLLAQIGLNPEDLEPLAMRSMSWNATNVNVIHAYSPLVPKFELWASPESTQKLADALQSAGAALCEAQSLEWLRILEGTPLYGADIRDRELPQETGQTRALHFAKGCYLGQEIVERIRSRGAVHRRLAQFTLDTEPAALPVELTAAGETAVVGRITSTALSNGTRYGLGIVRTEAVARHPVLDYPGGTATLVIHPPLARSATQTS